MHETRYSTQVLIVGSGLAGLTAALAAAEAGLDTTLITSGSSLDTGNTALAQGGIVYRNPENDPKMLEHDIMEAGREYNYRRAVQYLCRKGPEAVQRILVNRLHIPFAQTKKCEWDLRLEGGHGAKRILYCADFTGRQIMDGLTEAVQNEPNIRILNKRTAVDLLTSHHHSTKMEYKYHLTNRCVGCYVLNEDTREVETVIADHTILATGGLGQIYLHTTNTPASVGSALSMAYRAGARVMNAEFVQFHPTALFHRTDRRFLITEAMRGNGAKLVDGTGEPFMNKYHERADLAPRDVVSRAILDEMLHSGEDCVFLNVADYAEVDLKEKFPTIFEKCLNIGIDIRKDPIPVVPAAHYFCGGVLVDIKGRTTLDRLYAAGECTCSGVHGANRLASTSLLECVLWGLSAAEDIAQHVGNKSVLKRKLVESIPNWINPGEVMNEDPALIAQDWITLRNTMWNYTGIIRTGPRLQRAFEDLRDLYKHIIDFYKRTPLSKPLVDLFHGTQAAYIVTMAARRNKESVGCHYRVD